MTLLLAYACYVAVGCYVTAWALRRFKRNEPEFDAIDLFMIVLLAAAIWPVAAILLVVTGVLDFLSNSPKLRVKNPYYKHDHDPNP
jgi:ABC-type branched-subunit amino acid transport system permease subunit